MPMIWPIRLRGLSDANGSWKTICISLRSGSSCLPAGVRDVLAAEADAALGGLEQPHERARQRRLAAARLADEPERLALGEVERHVVDGVHAARPRGRSGSRRGSGSAASGARPRAAAPSVLCSARRSYRHALLGGRPISPGAPRAARASARRVSQQRSRCAGASATRASSGGTFVHLPNSCGQRGRKWQPSGRSASDGGSPAIAGSRSGRGRSTRVIEPSRPHV